MIDENPKQTRRRLKLAAYFAAIFVTAAVISIVVLVIRRDSSHSSGVTVLIRNASAIRLGQDKAEVIRQLGAPQLTYGGGTLSGVCYGRDNNLLDHIADVVDSVTGRNRNRNRILDPDAWPVHIKFDSSGKVDRIKVDKSVTAK